MTNEELSEKFKNLDPLHKRHDEILEYLNIFCEEHNITWCLAAGSALGARRHGGPIPWDDDVDIIMPVADYERFREEFRKHGDHERFYLQEKVVVKGMAEAPKLRMNHTTMIEPGMENLDMHHGIFIDIFLVHNCPKSRFMVWMGKWLAAYMELKIMSNQGYNKRKAYASLMAFLRLFPRNFGMKTVLKFEYHWDKIPSDDVIWWFIGTNPLKRDLIYPVRRVAYDGMMLPVPQKLEEYLVKRYGDWKKLPEISEITWHLHAANWSADEDFRKFAPNVKDFSFEMGSNEKEQN